MVAPGHLLISITNISCVSARLHVILVKLLLIGFLRPTVENTHDRYSYHLVNTIVARIQPFSLSLKN